jgi:mannan endo-1,4-beta-mannosidase
MSEHPTRPLSAAWWVSSTGGLSVRARVAAMALALSLLAVSYLVWVSPGNADSAGDAAVAAEPQKTADEIALEKQVAALRGQLRDARSEAQDLRDGQAKAAAEREAGRLSGQAKAAEERAAAAARGKARDAAGRTGTTSTKTKAATGAATKAAAAAEAEEDSAPANPRNPALPGPVTPVQTPTETRLVTPSKEQLVTPSDRYFGLYTVESPFNFSTYDDVSAKAGRAPSVAGYFQGWDKPFRPDAVTRSWERGALPLLTWESRPMTAANDQVVDPAYSLPRIIGDPAAGVPGAFDDYLREYARGIADLGLPLAIRLDHEMNGDWYPWAESKADGTPLNGNRPGDYVARWRHVHDIFEAEGANQFVIWVWAPNIVNNLVSPHNGIDYTASLYPGDEYVDWTGLSGYLRPPFRAGNDWTFQYTFDQSLDQLREIADKPILIAETGATEISGSDPGQNKPAWVSSFFQAFTRPENDDVIGFAWFNLTVTSTTRGNTVTNDWRVDSSAAAREAFAEGLNDPAADFGQKATVTTAPVAAAVPAPLSPAGAETAAALPVPLSAPPAEPTVAPAPEPAVDPTPVPSSPDAVQPAPAGPAATVPADPADPAGPTVPEAADELATEQTAPSPTTGAGA